MEEILTLINEEMETLQIPYEYEQWTGAVQYPYFVGELLPEIPMNEDGISEYTFFLRGWTKKKFQTAINLAATFRKRYPVTGRHVLQNGKGISIFYDTLNTLPHDQDEEIKSVEFRFTIKLYNNE